MEEAKERYLKASRKLHQTHNDYILLLNEAMNYEHHLRTTLLPGLLQYQQTVQQEAIDCWYPKDVPIIWIYVKDWHVAAPLALKPVTISFNV